MTAVTNPDNPDTTAIRTARARYVPFTASLAAKAIAQTTQAPNVQNNHPHHGRADGLNGMARIVALGFTAVC